MGISPTSPEMMKPGPLPRADRGEDALEEVPMQELPQDRVAEIQQTLENATSLEELCETIDQMGGIGTGKKMSGAELRTRLESLADVVVTEILGKEKDQTPPTKKELLSARELEELLRGIGVTRALGLREKVSPFFVALLMERLGKRREGELRGAIQEAQRNRREAKADRLGAMAAESGLGRKIRQGSELDEAIRAERKKLIEESIRGADSLEALKEKLLEVSRTPELNSEPGYEDPAAIMETITQAREDILAQVGSSKDAASRLTPGFISVAIQNRRKMPVAVSMKAGELIFAELKKEKKAA